MFFKDINELKDYCSVNISADFKEFSLFLKRADTEFIEKNIGSTFYSYIQGVYDANSANYAATPANDKAAIEKLRYASAAYALYCWVPQGQLQIDSSGIRIANTDNLKTAFRWQIRDLQKSLITMANACMEEALKFFSDNKVTYTQYAASPEFSLFNDTFIKTAFEFSQYYSPLNNSRLKMMQLKPVITKVEDMDIQAVLFPNYYAALKAAVKNGTTTSADNNILPFIKSAVANLTIARAIDELAIAFDENGFIEFDNTGSDDTADSKKTAEEHRRLTASALERDGISYLKKLRDYLEANKASYTTYTSDPKYTTYTNAQFANTPTNNFFFGG